MNRLIIYLLRVVLTAAILIVFTFFALNLGSNSALTILGPEASLDAIENFNKGWGLDRPLWQQLFEYISRIFNGDLGYSLISGQTAIERVGERLPATLSLMIPTAIISISIGVPIGVYAAIHNGKLIDKGVMALSILGFAIPNFLVGIILIFIFSVSLGWLPPSGAGSWQTFIMPIVTMSTAEAAIFARFTRSAMVEVLGHPMMETALANGIPWRKAILQHALPNAAIPILTVIGMFMGSLISGAVITENVFAWPGIGSLLVDSVKLRDLAVVQTIVLLTGCTMIICNTLVDISYSLIDPRIKDIRQRDRLL